MSSALLSPTLGSPSRTTFSSSPLSTLPIELLSAIVREVAAFVLPPRHPAQTLRPVSEHVYENLVPGGSFRPALVALSEVDHLFWRLCTPHLWEVRFRSLLAFVHLVVSPRSQRFLNNHLPQAINLKQKIPADFLYFLSIILPRHGRHVRSLDCAITTGRRFTRATVPQYLAEALGISSQYGYSITSTTPPIDLVLLGEHLVPATIVPPKSELYLVPPPARDPERQLLELQCANLLGLIVASPLLPGLTDLSLYIGPDAVISKTFATLRSALVVRPTRPTRLSITSGEGRRSIDPTRSTPEALSGVLDSCPDMTDLTVRFGNPDDHARPAWTSLRKLEALERLEMDVSLLNKSWNAGSWKAPLTELTLDSVGGTTLDILHFLGHFRSTLVKLRLEFEPREAQDDSESNFTVSKSTFPRLTNLSLIWNIPDGFVHHFSLSPLEIVKEGSQIGLPRPQGWPMDDWRKIFKDHGKTLKAVQGSRGLLSAEDQKELVAEAKKLDFSLEFTNGLQ